MKLITAIVAALVAAGCVGAEDEDAHLFEESKALREQANALTAALRFEGATLVGPAGPAEPKTTGPVLESFRTTAQVVDGDDLVLELVASPGEAARAVAVRVSIRHAERALRIPVAFDADGRATLAGRIEGAAGLLGLRTEAQIALLDASGMVGPPGVLILWFAESPTPNRGQHQALLDHLGPTTSLVSWLDGEVTRLASGGADRAVHVWDLNVGRRTARLRGHTGAVRAMAVTSDGSRLLSASDDGTVRHWDLATGELLLTDGNYLDRVASVVIAPDDSLYIAGSWDGTVQARAIADGALVVEAEVGDRVNGVALAPSTGLFAAGFGRLSLEGGVLVVSATTQEELLLQATEREVTGVVFSPDGQLLAVAEGRGNVHLFDTSTMAEVATLMSAGEDTIAYIGFPPNSNELLVTTTLNGIASRWDLAQQTAEDIDLERPLTSAVFGPNAARAIIGDVIGMSRAFEIAE